MMTYVLQHNPTWIEWPYSRQQLLVDNPNVSFPLEPTAEDLEPFGVFLVQPSNPPEFDHSIYKVKEVTPLLVDGVWSQQWEIQELSQEEKEDYQRVNRPAPRSKEFSLALLNHPVIQQLIAFTDDRKGLTSAYTTAFNNVIIGEGSIFPELWAQAKAEGWVTPEGVAQLKELAEECYMPESFVNSL